MKKAIVCLVLLFSFANAEKIGDWYYAKYADSINDSDRSFISNPSENEGGYLIFKCNGRILEISISSEEYLNSAGSIRTEYRFSGLKSSGVQDWDPASDGQGAFAPNEYKRAFVLKTSKHSSVRIRVLDYLGAAYIYSFKLKGFVTAFKKLNCSKGYL